MKTKYFSYTLIAIICVAMIFIGYTFTRITKIEKETSIWKTKYEEALIDMENANTRIALMKEDLEKALKDSETHRLQAEDALLQLQKKKIKK